jgi:hypothetical protein
MFAVVDDRYVNQQRTTARDLLCRIRAVLQAGCRSAKITLQRHSVSIEFAEGVAFDVIPAFARSAATRQGQQAEYFEIAEVEEPAGDDPGQYIPSNPNIFADWSTRVNDSCDKQLKPLFKLMKLWRRPISRSMKAHGDWFPLYSHLMEAALYRAIEPSLFLALSVPRNVSSLAYKLLYVFRRIRS